MSVDSTCIDEETNKFVDKPLTLRMVQWQPFEVKKPFDKKTPVCAACKRTNRTRNFCRERHKHRQLPWCTVYVLLSAVESTDPSTIVAGASQKVDGDRNGGATTPTTDKADSGSPASGLKPEDSSTPGSLVASETIGSDPCDDSDDIHGLPDDGVRTFLAKVSSAGCTIHWLAMGNDEGLAESSFGPSSPSHAMADAMPKPAALDPHLYSYAQQFAQHQQNQFKSQQQFYHHMQQHQFMASQPQHTPGPAPQQTTQASPATPLAPQAADGVPTWYTFGSPVQVSEDADMRAYQREMTAGEAASRQRTDAATAAAVAHHQAAWAHYYQQMHHHQQQQQQHNVAAVAASPHATQLQPLHPTEDAFHTLPGSEPGHDEDSLDIHRDNKRQRTNEPLL